MATKIPRMSAAQRQKLMERQEFMRRTLRLLALQFDADARFTVLAPNIGVHVNALNRWIENGYMPATTAQGLQSRFGVTLAPAKQLARQ